MNYFAKNNEKSVSPIFIKQIQRWGAILPGTFSCLPQSLAVKLKDRQSTINFGVQNNLNFEAHAWVEKGGSIIIGERPNDNFKSLWTW